MQRAQRSAGAGDGLVGAGAAVGHAEDGAVEGLAAERGDGVVAERGELRASSGTRRGPRACSLALRERGQVVVVGGEAVARGERGARPSCALDATTASSSTPAGLRRCPRPRRGARARTRATTCSSVSPSTIFSTSATSVEGVHCASQASDTRVERVEAARLLAARRLDAPAAGLAESACPCTPRRGHRRRAAGGGRRWSPPARARSA